MWEPRISVGCAATWALWAAGFGFILTGWIQQALYMGHLGLATVGAAVALTVVRDNARTRRQIRGLDRRQGRGAGGGDSVREFVRREDRRPEFSHD